MESDHFNSFFEHKGWDPAPYQKKAFEKVSHGINGLINAPTGSGKTYSLLLPIFIEGMRQNHNKGLFAIWVNPLRAIAQEIKNSADELNSFFGLDWDIAIRTGDTPTSDRQKQKEKPPQILITTPESIHVLFASKGYSDFFSSLSFFVVDEWHELISSKRAVLVELALSRLKSLNHNLNIWGISATIGNLEQAMEVLLGKGDHLKNSVLIRSQKKKKIKAIPLIPKSLSEMQWAGNFGLVLKHKVIEVIKNHGSTLVFTNTRAMTERWYQELLAAYPELAGQIALHHGSLEKETRIWVEEALHMGKLKAVVCTSSLDLGVDFRPVDAIVQVGSPKGVSRFFQRAGRSNHSPGQESIVYFLPTHSMEVIEFLALRDSLKETNFESRPPNMLCFDVLSQYLVTLAVSEGFKKDQILKEIRGTYSFNDIQDQEFEEVMSYILRGGKALESYDDYNKVHLHRADEKYYVTSKGVASRHRLSIGTIVSDQMMRVKYKNGGYLGMIEESFLSRLFKDDAFIFGGKTLKLENISGNVAYVKKAKSKKAQIPSYQGGRMSLTTQLGHRLREAIYEVKQNKQGMPQLIRELIEVQEDYSIIPDRNTLLIEYLEEDQEKHLLVYTFEGRQVHEALASLLAHRISKVLPISFSLAYNDYGFELLTDDKKVDLKTLDFSSLFSPKNLSEDLVQSINSAEMGRRKFRDIAGIAGLIFNGFPGRQVKERHLRNSTSLLFSVFEEYDSDHILFRQAYREVFEYQIEEDRMRKALERIQKQEITLQQIQKPTPFALPIMLDQLRERLSSEKVEERLEKLLGVEIQSL